MYLGRERERKVRTIKVMKVLTLPRVTDLDRGEGEGEDNHSTESTDLASRDRSEEGKDNHSTESTDLCMSDRSGQRRERKVRTIIVLKVLTFASLYRSGQRRTRKVRPKNFCPCTKTEGE